MQPLTNQLLRTAKIDSSPSMSQLVIDSLEQLIYWQDTNLVFQGCNLPFAQAIGLSSPADIVGKTAAELPSQWSETCGDQGDCHQSQKYTILWNHPTASDKTWLKIHKSPIRNPQGEAIGILTTIELETDSRPERFRSFIETINDWVWETDKNAIFTYVGPQIESLLGYKAEEVLGKTPFDFMLPEEQARIAAVFQNLVAAKKPLEKIENINLHKDGHWVILETSGVPFFDDNGNLLGYRGIDRDITERIQVQEELKNSQERLAMLIQQTPLAVIEWNCSFEIQEWNQAAQRIFGYSKSEVLHRHFDFLVPDCTREHVTQVLFDLITQNGGTHSTNENITKDGRIIICEWHNYPIIAANGEAIGIASIIMDVTERKQAEAQLQEKEQFLRTVYDGADISIVVVDVLEDGDFRYAGFNTAAQRASNLIHTQVVGKIPEEVHGVEEGALMRQKWQKSVESGKASTSEFCVGFGDKKTYWLTTINPLKDSSGRIYRLVGTTFDISDRKQAEAQVNQKAQDLETALLELQQAQIQLVQSEKMSGLGQLVAGIAHEINNPVNFIYGNLNHADHYTQDILELVQKYQYHYQQPVPEIKEFVENIDLDFVIQDLPKLMHSMNVGALRIRQIVLSLRTFSRMDEAEMKYVDIHEGIDSTLMILEHRIKAKEYRRQIEVIKSYGKLPQVECFAGQLNQVFMNILANAIDALEDIIGEEFQPQIKISTEIVESKVSICIADNGSGIPEHIQKRLFDPFFTTKPVGKGTGMGLSISYQIINDKHGGSLKCISAPGQGTEFVITIPQTQVS